MTQPKRGLGRGLDALFGGSPVETAPPAPPPADATPAEPQKPPPAATPLPQPEPVPAPANEQAPVDASPPHAPEPASTPGEVVREEPLEEPRAPVWRPVATMQPHNNSEPHSPASEAADAPETQAPTHQPGQTGAEPVMNEPLPPLELHAPGTGTVAARRGSPDQLDIDLIAPNPEQPRTHFEPEKLRELSDSIREHGIIQPLVVSIDEDGGYRLIAGERRLQAARLAGLETVPVVIREAADSELLELALIENIQRADLNAIEEAMAYRRLIEEYGLTQEEAARRVGKSRVTVSNALRLLQLESEIRRSLVGGEITEGHARALLGLPEGRGRVNAWREVVKRKLSVRDTESFVRRSLADVPATASAPGAVTARRDAAISDIESRLRRALSTRVSVQPQKHGARIMIECYSNEEFDNVVATLLGDDA